MIDRREKDAQWYVRNEQGVGYKDFAILAVLMDIRDEMKSLNKVMHCWRVQAAAMAMIRLKKRMGRGRPLRRKKGAR